MKRPFDRRFAEHHDTKPGGAATRSRVARFVCLVAALIAFGHARAADNIVVVDEATAASLAALLQSGKVEVQFCNKEVLQADECNALAEAIRSNSAIRLDPGNIVSSREDADFQTLGHNCPPRAVSSAGLPMALYDLEVNRTAASAHGPFSVFDLSRHYTSWTAYSLLLAEGFARRLEAQKQDQPYPWVAAYFVPKSAPCQGYQVAAFFGGDAGQPSTLLHHVEVATWMGKVFLISFEGTISIGLPIYVTVYAVEPDAARYAAQSKPLDAILGFLVDIEQ